MAVGNIASQSQNLTQVGAGNTASQSQNLSQAGASNVASQSQNAGQAGFGQPEALSIALPPPVISTPPVFIPRNLRPVALAVAIQFSPPWLSAKKPVMPAAVLSLLPSVKMGRPFPPVVSSASVLNRAKVVSFFSDRFPSLFPHFCISFSEDLRSLPVLRIKQ